MSQDTPLTTNTPLQIGIELEFVCPHDTAWERQNLPAFPEETHGYLALDACYHRLASSLDAAGLPAAYTMRTGPVILDPSRNPFRARVPAAAMPLRNTRILGDPARYPHPGHLAGLFDYWHVKHEGFLTTDKRYLGWLGAELNSPIIPERRVFGSSSSSSSSSSFSELTTALRAAHGASGSVKPHISRMCGLHVHLSPANHPAGCAADYARRVVTLTHLLDRVLLFPLCHPSRLMEHGPISAVINNSHPPPPPAAAAALPAAARACLPASLIAADARNLYAIWTANSLVRLLINAEPIRRGGRPRMSSLMHKPQFARPPADAPPGTRPVAGPQTIEFRHAQASFCAAFVRNWTKIVLAIGRVALLPPAEFAAAVDRLWAVAATMPPPAAAPSATSSGMSWSACETSLDILRVLSDQAARAGLPEPLDVAFWRRRLRDMHDGRNPDIDEDGKARID